MFKADLPPGAHQILFYLCFSLLLHCGSSQRTLPLPQDKAQRILYKDFIGVVDDQVLDEWYIDKIAIEKTLQAAMKPACLAGKDLLVKTVEYIENQVQKQGTIEELLQKYQKPENFATELRLYRTSLVAKRSLELINENACPPWAQKVVPYRGVNNNYKKRFTGFETGLRLITQTRDSTKVGTGFMTRFLTGYGLYENTDILTGLEFGAASRFEAIAQETTIIIITGAIPFIYRFKTENLQFDIETAAAFYYENIFKNVAVGMRLGFGFSPTTLNLGPISPKLILTANYEYYPRQRNIPEQHQVSFGVNAALSFKAISPL